MCMQRQDICKQRRTQGCINKHEQTYVCVHMSVCLCCVCMLVCAHICAVKYTYCKACVCVHVRVTSTCAFVVKVHTANHSCKLLFIRRNHACNTGVFSATFQYHPNHLQRRHDPWLGDRHTGVQISSGSDWGDSSALQELCCHSRWQTISGWWKVCCFVCLKYLIQIFK